MANPNETLGFLQGFYGVGATIAPLVATAMITRSGLGWYTFYYLMVSLMVKHASKANSFARLEAL